MGILIGVIVGLAMVFFFGSGDKTSRISSVGTSKGTVTVPTGLPADQAMTRVHQMVASTVSPYKIVKQEGWDLFLDEAMSLTRNPMTYRLCFGQTPTGTNIVIDGAFKFGYDLFGLAKKPIRLLADNVTRALAQGPAPIGPNVMP